METPGLTIPVSLLRREERRQAERYVAAMPVTINGRDGVTQDLSSTGLSFVAERPYEIGSRVEVLVEYLLDGHQYPLQCQAEVVRVESCDEGFTIGARLLPEAALQEVSVQDADSVSPEAGVSRQRLRTVD
jgi:hypothetical protein